MAMELKGILYYLFINLRHGFIIFWSILLSILVVTLLLTLLIPSSIFFALSIPIYVFCSIMAYITVKNAIPFLVKMGAVRKALFIGIGIYFIIIAFINAIVANTIFQLLQFLKWGVVIGDITFQVPSGGKSVIQFIHLATFIENTWFTRVVIDFSVIILLMVFAYIFGLIYYRYGSIGSIGTMGIIAILFIIGIANGWLIDLMQTIFSSFNLNLFYQVCGLGIIIYLLSFLLIRRITIR